MIYNGLYTFVNPTGDWRTVRVHTQPADSKFCPGKRVVGLLAGPDNEGSYKSFGFVDNEHRIHTWKKFRDSRVYMGLTIFLRMASQAIEKAMKETSVFDDMPDIELSFEPAPGVVYKVLSSRRCLNCNRTLTTPTSVRTGYGPECRKRIDGAKWSDQDD